MANIQNTELSGTDANVENAKKIQVAIIGAGFSGLCSGIQLLKNGISDFVIFEKSEEVGGTWHWNTYPGLACDIPSILYSFSFELNPDWSHKYSPQREIKDYLVKCADKYGLRPHIRFNTEITKASFDKSRGLWLLEAASGDKVWANILVSAVGGLNIPHYPEIPGIKDFQGISFHSARWEHHHDLSGKSVAVIGNAASAIQFIPQIAPQAGRLYIYQRTPKWIVPREDRAYSPFEKWLFKHIPLAMRLMRLQIWLAQEALWPIFIHYNGWMSKIVERMAKRTIKKHISDPGLQKVLIPDFKPGCQRLLISDDFYQSLQRDNVKVITSPIARITKNGIASADGTESDVDVIIYGTGFCVSEYSLDVKGLDGVELSAEWQKRGGAEAYLGITVPRFPNLFLLLGPNTGLGHNSVVFMIECQVQYLLQCIRALRERKMEYMDLQEDALRRWHDECRKSLSKTVWATNCHSWYKSPNGEIHTLWPYSSFTYWLRTRKANIADYNYFSDHQEIEV